MLLAGCPGHAQWHAGPQGGWPAPAVIESSTQDWVALPGGGRLSQSSANCVRTENLTVCAGSAAAAGRYAQWAEFYRKEKALEWLGKEMPRWPRPCPIKVTQARDG